MTGGLAHYADVAILFKPSVLTVIGDIAPKQILASGVPADSFGPKVASVVAHDSRVADLDLREAGVKHQNVRFRIASRGLVCVIPAWGLGASEQWGSHRGE